MLLFSSCLLAFIGKDIVFIFIVFIFIIEYSVA
jgi:hypothetical protein